MSHVERLIEMQINAARAMNALKAASRLKGYVSSLGIK